MKTPSTLTLTVKTEPRADLEAMSIESMGLLPFDHEHERQIHHLLQFAHAGNPCHQVKRPEMFMDKNSGVFWVRYLGKCAHGRLIEIKTTWEGERIDSFGCLVGHDGDIAALSMAQEKWSADCRSAVRYTRTGEIASIDKEAQATIAKICRSWLAKRLQAHRVPCLHVSEYRSDWHDNTPTTLQAEPKAPGTKALRKAG